MAFRLGRPAEAWNVSAKCNRNAFYSVRYEHYNRLHCTLPAQVSPSELRVLTAITGRTLRFKKYGEAISADVFCHGLRDAYDPDEYVRGGDGVPYFTGCGISKPDTIYKAIAGLEEKGLITVWRSTRSAYANVYMPFSEAWLARATVDGGGNLPIDYGFWLVGERVVYEDCQFRIISLEGDVAKVVRLGSSGNPTIETYKIPLAALRRCVPRTD